MKILYLDCFSGISGDMALGAFLDLGVKQERLLEELKKLKVDGYKIKISQKGKNGIMGTDVDVILEDHDHSHDRNLSSIETLINNSDLDEEVKTLSKEIFLKVAQVESKIHGKPIDKVHFHELGAVDSIVDIVGVAICLNALKVDQVISSPLHTGTGFVHCQHGVIPVPAPATLEILRESKVPFYGTGVPKELVTPTGAAIIATIADEFGPMPQAEAVAIGYGTGKRDLKMANLLRMVLLESKKTLLDEAWVIEANIDDMTGEIAGYTMEVLLEQGALDVFYTPIYMKKNRPAIKLSVLCLEEQVQNLQEIIFKETTTIGIRMYQTSRLCMDREWLTIQTKYGDIRVKKAEYNGIIKYAPEYEDCKRAGRKANVPVQTVYQAALGKMPGEF